MMRRPQIAAWLLVSTFLLSIALVSAANSSEPRPNVLFISAPAKKTSGQKSNALVEFVDIYPTLTELCGLPAPGKIDGLSFAPVFDSPNLSWKQAAFSQYQRKVPGLGLAMGQSVCNARYRYTEWTVPEKDFLARELYDHQTDPDENINIANRPESAEAVKTMAQLLKGPKNLLEERTARQ